MSQHSLPPQIPWFAKNYDRKIDYLWKHTQRYNTGVYQFFINNILWTNLGSSNRYTGPPSRLIFHSSLTTQEHMEFTVQIQQTWTGVTFSSFSFQRQVPLLGYCGLYKINQNKHMTFLLIFYSKYQLLLSQVAFLCSRGVLAVRHPPPLLWGQRGVNTVCHSDLRKYNSMCGRPRT